MMVPPFFFSPPAAPVPMSGSPANAQHVGDLIPPATSDTTALPGTVDPFATMLAFLLGSANGALTDVAEGEAKLPNNDQSEVQDVAVRLPRGKWAKAKTGESPDAGDAVNIAAPCGVLVQAVTVTVALPNNAACNAEILPQFSAAKGLPGIQTSESLPSTVIDKNAPAMAVTTQVNGDTGAAPAVDQPQRALPDSPPLQTLPIVDPKIVTPSAPSIGSAPGIPNTAYAAPFKDGGSAQLEQVAGYRNHATQAYGDRETPPPDGRVVSTLPALNVDKSQSARFIDDSKAKAKDEVNTQSTAPKLPSAGVVTPNVVVVNDTRSVSGRTPPVAVQVGNAIAARWGDLQRDGQATLHLRLDPPGLGAVRIHLSVTEQTVSARLVVHAESTQHLLESQAGFLRDRLQESGVTLSRFDVACDSSGTNGNWEQRHQASEAQPLSQDDRPRAAVVRPKIQVRQPQGLIDIIV